MLSSLALASVRLSGLNAIELTQLVCPVSGWPIARGWAGSATLHNWIVPLSLPLASVRPSGLNATEFTTLALSDGGWSVPGDARDQPRPTIGPCRRSCRLPASARPD